MYVSQRWNNESVIDLGFDQSALFRKLISKRDLLGDRSRATAIVFRAILLSRWKIWWKCAFGKNESYLGTKKRAALFSENLKLYTRLKMAPRCEIV